MRASTALLFGGLGIAGYFLWRYLRQQAPAGGTVQDARVAGMQAGIDAGTYDASALRNAMIAAGMPGTA